MHRVCASRLSSRLACDPSVMVRDQGTSVSGREDGWGRGRGTRRGGEEAGTISHRLRWFGRTFVHFEARDNMQQLCSVKNTEGNKNRTIDLFIATDRIPKSENRGLYTRRTPDAR